MLLLLPLLALVLTLSKLRVAAQQDKEDDDACKQISTLTGSGRVAVQRCRWLHLEQETLTEQDRQLCSGMSGGGFAARKLCEQAQRARTRAAKLEVWAVTICFKHYNIILWCKIA